MDHGLSDDGPGAIRLLTGAAAGRLRLTRNEDLLRVSGAAEASRVVRIIADTKISIMSIAWIAPLIRSMGPAGIEAVKIGSVSVAPILAIEILSKGSTQRATDDHARNRRSGLSAVAADSTPQQAAD